MAKYATVIDARRFAPRPNPTNPDTVLGKAKVIDRYNPMLTSAVLERYDGTEWTYQFQVSKIERQIELGMLGRMPILHRLHTGPRHPRPDRMTEAEFKQFANDNYKEWITNRDN